MSIEQKQWAGMLVVMCDGIDYSVHSRGYSKTVHVMKVREHSTKHLCLLCWSIVVKTCCEQRTKEETDRVNRVYKQKLL